MVNTELWFRPLKMDKEINNANIFGKLLPDKKFRKILLCIPPATVQDYWMIKLVVYLTRNWLEHIQTQCEKTVPFLANYHR